MIQYQAVKEKHHHPDIGAYTAWGIKGWRTGEREQVVIAYIPDIFLHQKEAERFASLCTQLNVAFVHLFDVVQDYLAA